MQDILISDSCVLLDFFEIGELQLLLNFRDRIIISEDLLMEELPNWEEEIRSFGFRLDSLTSSEMQHSFLPLMGRYLNSGLSYFDVAVLTLAKVRNATLLTGDKRLRKAAVEQKVELRGTIFLLQELVSQKVLSVEATLNLLERMRQAGSRLPWVEAKRLILEVETPK